MGHKGYLDVIEKCLSEGKNIISEINQPYLLARTSSKFTWEEIKRQSEGLEYGQLLIS